MAIQSDCTGTGAPSAARRGYEISAKAASAGFDWENPADVLDKIAEELAEVREALRHPEDRDHLEEEIGDLFFALVNFNRKVDIDSDTAFMKGVVKFERRYHALEKLAHQMGFCVEQLDAEALDDLWNRVKYEENHGSEHI